MTTFIEIDNYRGGKISVSRNNILMITTERITTTFETIFFRNKKDIMELFCLVNQKVSTWTKKDIEGLAQYFDFILIDEIIIAKNKINTFANDGDSRTVISLPWSNWDDYDPIIIDYSYEKFKEIMNNPKKFEAPTKFKLTSGIKITISVEKIMKTILGNMYNFIMEKGDVTFGKTLIKAGIKCEIKGILHGGSEDNINCVKEESTDDTIVFYEMCNWTFEDSTYDYNIKIKYDGNTYTISYVECSLKKDYNMLTKTVEKKFDGGMIEFK